MNAFAPRTGIHCGCRKRKRTFSLKKKSTATLEQKVELWIKRATE